MISQGLKAIYNEAKLKIKITPKTPILIKTGETLDPTKPDMEFTRLKTSFAPMGVVYLPGSSLKGVVRSCSERLLRTLGLDICNIVEESKEAKDKSCTAFYRHFEEKKPGNERMSYAESVPINVLRSFIEGLINEKNLPDKLPYKAHCYACRTFGSTDLASRTFFTDFFPWRESETNDEKKNIANRIEINNLQIRPGISIDRRKGKVKHGPFEMEILTGVDFYGEITLKNYQLWQIGLLFMTAQELNDGFQKIGYGKTRGLGKINFSVEEVTINQFGVLKVNEICGIGVIKKLEEEYKLYNVDQISLSQITPADKLIFNQFLIQKEIVNQLQKETLNILAGLIKEKGGK